MAQSVFSLDGKYYDVRILKLERAASVLDGENAGRVLSGSMDRDIIGTYYNYNLEIDGSNLDPDEYDDLFEKITAPVESHTMRFPYGKRGDIEFEAYISSATDELVRKDENGNYIWSGMSLSFVAMEPYRLPE